MIWNHQLTVLSLSLVCLTVILAIPPRGDRRADESAKGTDSLRGLQRRVRAGPAITVRASAPAGPVHRWRVAKFGRKRRVWTTLTRLNTW